MNQPVPEVTEADVARIVERDFPPGCRERIRAQLAACEPALAPRVALAVLKLSNADENAVADQLAVANADPRDVIAYAEYPGYMAATRSAARLEPARRDEIIRADWQQYEGWLRG